MEHWHIGGARLDVLKRVLEDRQSRVARMRASATLIDVPRISPILRRAVIGSAAKAPWPSIGLGRTSTSNF